MKTIVAMFLIVPFVALGQAAHYESQLPEPVATPTPAPVTAPSPGPHAIDPSTGGTLTPAQKLVLFQQRLAAQQAETYAQAQSKLAERKQAQEQAQAETKERASWEKINGKVTWIGDGMLVTFITESHGIGAPPGLYKHSVHVAGFPNQQEVVEQEIAILAKRSGDYSYTGLDGGRWTVPNYTFMSVQGVKVAPTPGAFGAGSGIKGSALDH